MDIARYSVFLQPGFQLLARPEQLSHHGALTYTQLFGNLFAAVTHNDL
jgi:hypothetical protein